MAKFKINKTENYTIIANTHLKERKMSLKSKGLLTLMLSLPDDWNYSLKGLVSLCSESESAIKSSLQELKKFGYLRIQKIAPKKGSGKFEYIYEIFESPLKEEERQRVNKKVENLQLENQPDENVTIENLKVENQPVENLQLENQPDILSTKQSRTKELNTKELNTKEKYKKEKQKNEIEDFINSQDKSEEYKNLLFEFVKYRKKIKKTLKTIKPIENLIRNFSDTQKLSEALEIMQEKEWQSIEPEWVENHKKSKLGVKNENNTGTGKEKKFNKHTDYEPDYTKGFDDWN